MPDVLNAHTAGLLGAMHSRMITWRGVGRTHIDLWHEVAPFALVRDKQAAINAMAEYVLLVEGVEADVLLVRRTINEAWRTSGGPSSLRKMIRNPAVRTRHWWLLLDDDVRADIAG